MAGESEICIDDRAIDIYTGSWAYGVMKVLVTGATGFAGSNLCKQLVAKGCQVVALVRPRSNLKCLNGFEGEIVYGDLCDPPSLHRAVKTVDTVYNIAAIFRQESVPRELFWKVNAEGVKHLLEASIKNGVRRFVHCSTVGVHGNIIDAPANEDAPYAPGDLYQMTKLEGEKIAQAYMKEGKIAVTIFRPAGIYGPGDLRFLKLYYAIKKRRFVMLGKGEVNYHLTYIDDLVDGIIKCGTNDKAIGRVYILAGNCYVSLNELVRMIADALHVRISKLHFPLWPVAVTGFICERLSKFLGCEPILYTRRIDFFRKNRAFDISRARHELGFHPQIDLKEGIRRTAHWYADNGYL